MIDVNLINLFYKRLIIIINYLINLFIIGYTLGENVGAFNFAARLPDGV